MTAFLIWNKFESFSYILSTSKLEDANMVLKLEDQLIDNVIGMDDSIHTKFIPRLICLLEVDPSEVESNRAYIRFNQVPLFFFFTFLFFLNRIGKIVKFATTILS